MSQPKLQKKITAKQFRDTIANHVDELEQWVKLSVDAFPSDPQARKERLLKVRDEKSGYRFFLETYLPHYVRGEASQFHEHLFVRVPEVLHGAGGARECDVAHRGASKSTHLSLGAGLYCIALGLKHYIIEISDVYGQAVLLLEAIKTELTTNPRLKHDFPDVCGEGRIWREGEIVTKNNIRLEALGALQKLRGRRHGPYRPDLVFLDDIENDENVQNPKQRNKLEDWIDKAVLKLGPPNGSIDVFYVGTILHFDSVLARKSKSPAWKVTEFPAVIRWPDRMDLWEAWEEVYLNEGVDAARAFYDAHRADLDKGAVINWPSVQPLLKLMFERATSHGAFESEYQNNPISADNPFNDITFWVARRPDVLTFGAIDPSLGRKNRNTDPSAILVGAIDPEGQLLDVLTASIRRRTPDVIIEDAIAMQREHRCQLWFVETVQFQEMLRTELMKRAAKAGLAMPCYPVNPLTDKTLRIERLQIPVADGMIRLHPSQKTLITQLQQWPNADHDDGPDCLEMLWQHSIKFGVGTLSATSIRTDNNTSAQGALTGGYRLG